MENLVRLAKVISHYGVCSRREAEKLIQDGRVEINGFRYLEYLIEESSIKQIKIDGKIIKSNNKVRLWKYYKPTFSLVTNSDPEGRTIIFDLLPKNLPRVVTVGRLDYMSEGLLLLTNNVELAAYLENPQNAVTRTYKVRVFGKIPEDFEYECKKGLRINDFDYKPIEVKIISSNINNSTLELKLTEGKNREIRNIMDYFGLNISKLIRVGYGLIELGQLKPNEMKEIDYAVINKIRN